MEDSSAEGNSWRKIGMDSEDRLSTELPDIGELRHHRRGFDKGWEIRAVLARKLGANPSGVCGVAGRQGKEVVKESEAFW